MIAEGEGVIARGRRDDPTPPLLVGQLQQRVSRPSLLEAARRKEERDEGKSRKRRRRRRVETRLPVN